MKTVDDVPSLCALVFTTFVRLRRNINMLISIRPITFFLFPAILNVYCVGKSKYVL